ncbi:MAG: ATP-dependent Clp protease ATP-binding subunit ClpA, partial [Neisseriaceae bacterium]|nr:ATP-dependent Clp protease ATP-binding subunit ClpA [Neisseriaceae bacterium]
MISVQLEKILQQVHEFALQQSHEFVGLEHLLYKIVQSSSNVRSALHQCGVDLALLEMQLLESIKNNTPTVNNADPEPTIGFERIIQRALIHVRQSSHQEVKPGDVVVAILDEDDSPAAYLLQINGVTR